MDSRGRLRHWIAWYNLRQGFAIGRICFRSPGILGVAVMYRARMSLVWCFFSLLPFLAATPALAQPAIPADQLLPYMINEFDVIKGFAKARFEASEANRHDLAKAQRDAIDVCFQERQRLYAAEQNEFGLQIPVSLHLVLETWAERVGAEAGVSDKPADRSKILASHWLYTWKTEQTCRALHHWHRIHLTTLLRARSARLADEIKLRELLDEEECSAPFLMPPAVLDGDENFSAEEVKAFAKAQFEASQARPRDLAQARRDAVANLFQIRQEGYRAGGNGDDTGVPITLDLLLNAWAELSEAELALSDKPADRLGVWLNRWLAAWQSERYTSAGYQVGRFSGATLNEVKSERLANEIELLKRLSDEKRSNPFAMLPAFLDSTATEDKHTAKEWARAQFEVSQAHRRDLEVARRDALKLVLQIRGDLNSHAAIEPGTGAPVTINHLRKIQSQLLEAELALSNNSANRLAAYEKDWAWAFLAEATSGALHRVGRSSLSAYARSRFNRLGVEIRLLEAEAATKDK